MTALPDDALDREVLVPLREYLELHELAYGGGPMVVDSAWLSKAYGYSQEHWAGLARAGRVEAWHESKGSPWYFDRASCLAHLERAKAERSSSKVHRRGPWVEQERRKAS